jgi:hypothetical protein
MINYLNGRRIRLKDFDQGSKVINLFRRRGIFFWLPLLFFAQMADADLDAKFQGSVDMSQMHVSVGVRRTAESMGDGSLEISGRKMRSDCPYFYAIADDSLHILFVVSPSYRKYASVPYTSNLAKQMMLAMAPAESLEQGVTTKIIATGQMKTILGYKAYRSKATYKVPMPTGIYVCTVDCYATTQIKSPELVAYDAWIKKSGLSDIPGFPLEGTTAYVGRSSPLNGMIMHYHMTSISTAPLPAITFQIPPGFTKVPTVSAVMPRTSM